MKLLDKLYRVWYSYSMKYLVLGALLILWVISLCVGIAGLATLLVSFFWLTSLFIPAMSIIQTLAFLYIWEKFLETN
jgi:hypothetical protein